MRSATTPLLAALSTLLLLLSPTSALPTAKLLISPSTPVCIIGAGPAGLSAASSLKASSIPVVILEARNRAGGRIWSSGDLGKGVNGNEPVVVDLGAGWLEGDGTGNPVYNLVKPYLPTETVISNFNNGVEYYVEGGEYPGDPEAGWTTIEDSITAQQDAEEDNSDPTLQTLINRAVSGQSGAAKAKATWQATMEVINEYAADPDWLSGWEFDSASDAPGKQRLWKNGYFTAFAPLLKGLNVTYGAVVSKVTYNPANPFVTVTSNKGDWKCSRVVMTASLGMLKNNKIAFSPSLPASKLASIKKLGMGVFNKIALRFPPGAYNQLPASTVDFLTFVPKTITSANARAGYYDFINFKKIRPDLKNPILVVIAAGSFGKKTESLPESTVISQIMTQLRASFPNLPDPIAHKITKWSSDPFTFGSYSYMAPGSSKNDYNELGNPVYTTAGAPWLQLAGEAYGSWPYPSTVHGAYSAGGKAAKKIVDTRTLG